MLRIGGLPLCLAVCAAQLLPTAPEPVVSGRGRTDALPAFAAPSLRPAGHGALRRVSGRHVGVCARSASPVVGDVAADEQGAARGSGVQDTTEQSATSGEVKDAVEVILDGLVGSDDPAEATDGAGGSETPPDGAAEVEARLTQARLDIEDARAKQQAQKHDLYLQSLAGNSQRMTTHNYLTLVQQDLEQKKLLRQQEIELQESRARRPDDFGETDREDGGVTEDGYVKRSRRKLRIAVKSMPEDLVAAATKSKKIIKQSSWGKLFSASRWRDRLWGNRLE